MIHNLAHIFGINASERPSYKIENGWLILYYQCEKCPESELIYAVRTEKLLKDLNKATP
jgi:hypothetical protein